MRLLTCVAVVLLASSALAARRGSGQRTEGGFVGRLFSGAAAGNLEDDRTKFATPEWVPVYTESFEAESLNSVWKTASKTMPKPTLWQENESRLLCSSSGPTGMVYSPNTAAAEGGQASEAAKFGADGIRVKMVIEAANTSSGFQAYAVFKDEYTLLWRDWVAFGVQMFEGNATAVIRYIDDGSEPFARAPLRGFESGKQYEIEATVNLGKSKLAVRTRSGVLLADELEVDFEDSFISVGVLLGQAVGSSSCVDELSIDQINWVKKTVSRAAVVGVIVMFVLIAMIACGFGTYYYLTKIRPAQAAEAFKQFQEGGSAEAAGHGHGGKDELEEGHH